MFYKSAWGRRARRARERAERTFVSSAKLPPQPFIKPYANSFKPTTSHTMPFYEETSYLDSLRGSSIKTGTMQRILARPPRKDDTHTSRRDVLSACSRGQGRARE